MTLTTRLRGADVTIAAGLAAFTVSPTSWTSRSSFVACWIFVAGCIAWIALDSARWYAMRDDLDRQALPFPVLFAGGLQVAICLGILGWCAELGSSREISIPRTFLFFGVVFPLLAFLVRWAGLASRTASSRPARKTAIIVGNSNAIGRLVTGLEERSVPKLRVLGYFGEPALASPVPWLGTLREAAPFVRREVVDHVFAMGKISDALEAETWLSDLADSAASLSLVPEWKDARFVNGTLGRIDGLTVLTLRQGNSIGVSAWIKRACDLVMGTLLFLLALPLMVGIALGLFVSSGLPIFFRQKRIGAGGETFFVVKFRSLDDPGGKATRFGGWLRRSCLDELPQLVQVLMGDMSLVGPRPLSLADNDWQRGFVPDHLFRHKVRPGLTGWSQVRGLRGALDEKAATLRSRYDEEYLRHASLGLDLVLLVLTPFSIFRGAPR